MSKVALDLGFIQIYWYPIFLFLSMLAGCTIIFKEAKEREVDEKFLINLAFGAILSGIIGARAFYVLFNWQYYMEHPMQIAEVSFGGLAIHGGIILGILAIFIVCRKHNINVLRTIDIISVGLIAGQAIGCWGSFFNSEAYGAITSLEALQEQGIPKFIIEGMYIMGEYRRPVFLYESIGCLVGFLAMLIIRSNKYLKRGTLTSFYLIWYGILRLIVEGLRADSLMLGPFKVAQVISIVYIVIGVMIFIANLRKGRGDMDLYRKDPNAVAMEQSVFFG